jgi:signal peptidase I
MKTPRRRLLKFAVVSAIFAGVGWLSGVRLFAFSGRSMEPAVMPGDYFVGLVALWGMRTPERFDMVIFELPPESRWAERKIPWMKRVVGLPGERVRLAGGRLFIDGREVSAPCLRRDAALPASADVEVVLKADEFFVVGDNLDHSLEDSRTMGPIRKSRLRGFVALVIRTAKIKAPNKTPEPTPGSVTLRATSRMTESKQWIAEPILARSAPAPGVAHL